MSSHNPKFRKKYTYIPACPISSVEFISDCLCLLSICLTSFESKMFDQPLVIQHNTTHVTIELNTTVGKDFFSCSTVCNCLKHRIFV